MEETMISMFIGEHVSREEFSQCFWNDIINITVKLCWEDRQCFGGGVAWYKSIGQVLAS